MVQLVFNKIYPNLMIFTTFIDLILSNLALCNILVIFFYWNNIFGTVQIIIF